MTMLLVGCLVASAVVMIAIYYPTLNRLTLAFASPYPKADLGKRLSAAMIDGLVVASTWMLYRQSRLWPYLAAGAIYVMLRDGIAGRSVGKFFTGLVVVDLRTSKPCRYLASAQRNVMFLLPGANVTAALLEASTVSRDPQGQRLGDRFAHTQVIEGLGAKDVVKAAVEWWRDFLAQLEGSEERRPRRVRSRV